VAPGEEPPSKQGDEEPASDDAGFSMEAYVEELDEIVASVVPGKTVGESLYA
jgi:hypothetical protein